MEPKWFGINFQLPEQEFLNLRLILFKKSFLQLIAQFSSTVSVTYLQRAHLLSVVNEFAFACQFRHHTQTVFLVTHQGARVAHMIASFKIHTDILVGLAQALDSALSATKQNFQI